MTVVCFLCTSSFTKEFKFRFVPLVRSVQQCIVDGSRHRLLIVRVMYCCCLGPCVVVVFVIVNIWILVVSCGLIVVVTSQTIEPIVV